MSTGEADDLVFKALGDSRRRAMLDLLRPAPRTTGEIVERSLGDKRVAILATAGGGTRRVELEEDG